MKFLGLMIATLLAVPAMACMGPAEFYSVVKPSGLGMFTAGTHKFVVGDVLVLRQGMTISKGRDSAVKIGAYEEEGYQQGSYYVLASEGTFTIREKNGAKVNSVEFDVTEPPRARGGCGDFRRPASDKNPTK